MTAHGASERLCARTSSMSHLVIKSAARGLRRGCATSERAVLRCGWKRQRSLRVPWALLRSTSVMDHDNYPTHDLAMQDESEFGSATRQETIVPAHAASAAPLSPGAPIDREAVAAALGQDDGGAAEASDDLFGDDGAEEDDEIMARADESAAQTGSDRRADRAQSGSLCSDKSYTNLTD